MLLAVSPADLVPLQQENLPDHPLLLLRVDVDKAAAVEVFALLLIGPRSLLRVKAGTHSPFGERSHTTAHTAKQGAFLPRPQRGLVLPAKLPPKE